MIAFLFLLGFFDARSQPAFGPRDAAVLMTALIYSFIINPINDDGLLYSKPKVGCEWFLYVYLWARLQLVCLSRLRPGLWQAGLILGAACLVPDFLGEELPDVLRLNVGALRQKGVRFTSLLMPGCYLLALNATRAGFPEWIKQNGGKLMRQTSEFLAAHLNHPRAEEGLQLSFCVACWALYLTSSVLCSVSPFNGEHPGYHHGWQAVYVEGENVEITEHAVSWEYMTHPSLLLYFAFWLGEFLLLILPVFAVGMAMAYMPWHFKTMGTTCFGSYLLHTLICFNPAKDWLTFPILSRITRESWDHRVNCFIVISFNTAFCLLFAHTAGAGFHWLLVSSFRKLTQMTARFASPDHLGWATKKELLLDSCRSQVNDKSSY